MTAWEVKDFKTKIAPQAFKDIERLLKSKKIKATKAELTEVEVMGTEDGLRFALVVNLSGRKVPLYLIVVITDAALTNVNTEIDEAADIPANIDLEGKARLRCCWGVFSALREITIRYINRWTTTWGNWNVISDTNKIVIATLTCYNDLELTTGVK